jgi:hypothetical protein
MKNLPRSLWVHFSRRFDFLREFAKIFATQYELPWKNSYTEDFSYFVWTLIRSLFWNYLFSFKCRHPDIVFIFDHWSRWLRRQSTVLTASLTQAANFPASLAPVAHLRPVSTTLHQRHRRWTLDLRIFSQIFERKNLNGADGIRGSPGEEESWKEKISKISWHCSFKGIVQFMNRFITDY